MPIKLNFQFKFHTSQINFCQMSQLTLHRSKIKLAFSCIKSKVKNSKGFEQKLASFGLKTPFKVQMGSPV